MGSYAINQIVDLDRYPLDQPDSPVAKELLCNGRKALDENALFSLTGFVRSEVIEEMAAELAGLVPISCRYDQLRNAYDYAPENQLWPNNHPRSQLHRCTYNQVLNYQIPNNSLIRQIYYWQPLTEFLRILCGYETFYRSDCPHLALTSKIAGEGDTDGWHFDTNDVVFSILIQAPETGGEFEYGPYIRTEQDEKYDAIANLIENPEQYAARPSMTVGNLTVFKGDLSMHRVTPVEGSRKRIVALFCYDRNPGTSFSQGYINELSSYLPN
jgi:hypothetical protein